MSALGHSRISSAVLLALAVAPVCGLFSSNVLAAADTWTGAADANWATAGNWTGGNAPPLGGDSLIFGTPVNSANDATANTLSNLAVSGVTFSAGADSYALNGPNGIVLGGNITNASGVAQTINLGLTLGTGLSVVSNTGATPGTIAVNGPVARTIGTAVYFGSGVTSTSLVADPNTGLIAGLGAAAAVPNSAGLFTSLATVSGGSVTAYTYTDANAQVLGATGTITSNVNSNVQLNATGSYTLGLDATTTTSTYLNSILTNNNNTANTSVTVPIAAGNTLVLGQVGGLFATNGGLTTADKNMLVVNGPGALSAGGSVPGTPGELILGVNGPNTNNQVAISNTGGIVDNGTGGTVTLVKTGTGSVVLSVANHYTGGTYIDQGYLQGNTSTSFGTGPVYIAPGATVFPNMGNGTFANTFYFSPGLGAFTNYGSMRLASGNITLTGTASTPAVVLTGAPVTTAPADRLSLNLGNATASGMATITGQISGGGTLEVYCSGSTVSVTLNLNNSSANVNNWTGGLIVDASSTSIPSVVKLLASNQLAGNNVTLVPGKSATLDLNGQTDSIGGLNSNPTVNAIVTNSNTSTAATLTLGANNASGTFGGVITDTGIAAPLNLIKNGSGTQTFTGASTYTGTTTINAGKLLVNNTAGSGLGAGNVTLNGGTLGGTGIITGSVTGGSGAHTLNPGSVGGIGTLTIGGLTTNANTTLAFDLTSLTGANDLLAVTGNVTLAGGNLAITSQSVTDSTSLGYYKVLSYLGTLTGSTSGFTLPTAANNVAYTLDTTQDPGSIDIHRGFIGDANDDGKVDLSDLNVVLNNLGTTNSSWGKGNFDGATTIDLTDLNDVLNHLGTSIASGSAVVATAAAPEPASLCLLALGATALIGRRRKA